MYLGQYCLRLVFWGRSAGTCVMANVLRWGKYAESIEELEHCDKSSKVFLKCHTRDRLRCECTRHVVADIDFRADYLYACFNVCLDECSNE